MAWREILGGRHAFSLGSFGASGPCDCCGGGGCSIPFLANGCGPGYEEGFAIEDVDVSVWTDSGKTTLVGSGTITFAEGLTIDVGSEGDYYVEATHPSGRFNDFAETLALFCDNYAYINFTIADGYICVTNCNIPTPETLYLTDNTLGITATLTYSSGSSLWEGPGDSNATLVGCGQSATVSLTYKFNGSGEVTVEYDPPGAVTTTGDCIAASASEGVFNCPIPHYYQGGVLTSTGCSVPANCVLYLQYLYGENVTIDIEVTE